jgi:hypothetical protein|tara:strand:- start:9717 stop:9929 length:213 start_codon:yes stop_codon:yes gene_type:complete
MVQFSKYRLAAALRCWLYSLFPTRIPNRIPNSIPKSQKYAQQYPKVASVDQPIQTSFGDSNVRSHAGSDH